MTQSLIAPLAGQRYQAWLAGAARVQLLEQGSNVVKVLFENPSVRSFDDIVVHHDPPVQARLTEQVVADHIQAKYHIGSGGAFTVGAMTDPAFIGADSSPLLRKLGDAFHRIGAEAYRRRRFWIVFALADGPGGQAAGCPLARQYWILRN